MYSEELPAEEKQPEKKARTSQNDVDSAATIFLPAEDEDHPIRADLQDALFEVTARPRYEKNNQKRRDQRQAQADIETEDLDAADPAKVAIAIKVWTSRVQKHLEIYSQVGRMLDGVRDSQLLGVAFTASSKEDGLCSNTGDADAAWANIDAPTVKWLTELAKNPLQVELAEAMGNGVLIESNEEADPMEIDGTGFYHRLFEMEGTADEEFSEERDGIRTSKTLLADAVIRYLASYPADTPWGIFILILLDFPLDAIHERLHPILTKLGFATLVNAVLIEIARLPSYTSFVPPILTSPVTIGYSGESGSVTPWQRVQQDANKDVQSRYGNFVRANSGFVSVRAYDIPSLRLPQSVGIKLDRNARVREYGLVSLFRGAALNSSTGGWLREYSAPSWAISLRDSLFPIPSQPFTGKASPAMIAKILKCCQDELRYLRKKHPGEIISDSALEAALRNLTCVSELDGHTMFLCVMKDISQEDFFGLISGIWTISTGRALREHRSILAQLFPGVLDLEGDLQTDTISHWVGPYVDFWRWTLRHLWFWLHILWFSRYLQITLPILLTSWSNPLYRSFTTRLLITVWDRIPHDVRAQILDGYTPDNIYHYIPLEPKEGWYPTCKSGDYLSSVGVLHILQSGPSTTILHLYIPELDPGAPKYAPREQRCMENLSFCVRLIIGIATHEIEVHRLRGIVPNYDDEKKAWHYMQVLSASIEARVVGSGLRAKIDLLKTELQEIQLTDRHFRSLVKSTIFRTRGVQRGLAINHLAARAEDRQTQFNSLLDMCDANVRGGMTADPFKLVPRPWRDSIGSNEHWNWFCSLKEGTSISHSARNFANTDEGYQRVLENQQKIGLWRIQLGVANRMGTAQMRKLMQEAMEFVLRIWDGQEIKELYRSFRAGTCPFCDLAVVGHHDTSEHRCQDPDDSTSTTSIPVKQQSFPNLDQLRTPNDIISQQPLLYLLADGGDNHDEAQVLSHVMDQYNLSAITVDTIFKPTYALNFLRERLHADDIWPIRKLAAERSSEIIYIPTDATSETAMMLAVDWLLDDDDDLPLVLHTLKAEDRRAWDRQNMNELLEWGLHSADRQEKFYVVRCAGDGLYVTPKLKTARRGDNKGVKTLKHKNASCADGGCAVIASRAVQNITDLPSHYKRRLWFHICGGGDKVKRGVTGTRKSKIK